MQLLRPRDQAVIAVFVTVGIGILLIDWLLGGDQIRPRTPSINDNSQTSRFLVDINSANWPEIAQLPNVGETLARRIVESREKAGRFRSTADLRRVRGLGKTTLERITPYLHPVE